MVKGREDLQRRKGEELFSLCPLEWLVKAIVTCEQSLSAISSLDLGGGGGGGEANLETVFPHPHLASQK